MRLLAVGLSLLEGGTASAQAASQGQVLAGSTLAAIPMIIIFLVFQRYFLRGITIGAIKG
jgi:multiple sugar transport system permease protein